MQNRKIQKCELMLVRRNLLTRILQTLGYHTVITRSLYLTWASLPGRDRQTDIQNENEKKLIPRLHDAAGSTSWLYERSTSARRASSSSQLHRVNGVLVLSRSPFL